MDTFQRCQIIKESLAAALDAEESGKVREDLLIESLYELSRAVLPELGYPRRSQEYLDQQAAVLDLITFIAIPLIKGAQERRGVAVLAEIAEGCQDPLLRKKLAVYAQELLAKLNLTQQKGKGTHLLAIVAGSSAAAALLIFLGWFLTGAALDAVKVTSLATQDVAPASSAPYHASGHLQASGEPSADPPRERRDEGPRQVASADARGGQAQTEQVTRVRIVNNQVLVPVTLKNNGELVKVELLLDTGASRTAIHETLSGKLRIDLRTTRTSQAEVADGRIVNSRVARIDSLAVGPYVMIAPQLELISYKGSEGIDGLLGMDFLGRHRYQIDMEREVIRWY